jgi:hypothetical protein
VYTVYAGLLASASINNIQNRAVVQIWRSVDTLAESHRIASCIHINCALQPKIVLRVDHLLYVRRCAEERLCRGCVEMTMCRAQLARWCRGMMNWMAISLAEGSISAPV